MPYRRIHKFAYAPDVRTTTDPTDVWIRSDNAAVPIPSPASPAATTLVSANAADDAAGTGVQAVDVWGLRQNSDLDNKHQLWLESGVATTGGGSTTLDTQFMRCFRLKPTAYGSGAGNAGAIRLQHGATIFGEIGTLFSRPTNKTLQSNFTIPELLENAKTVVYGEMVSFTVTVGRAGSARATVAWMSKPITLDNWEIEEIHDFHAEAGANPRPFVVESKFDPLTEFKFEVFEVSATVSVSVAYEVRLHV